jgi:DNA-binding NarL/FixJ family response regulator
MSADRLIDIDADVRELQFRHPLIRSAIRQSATAGDRRAAHAALATVLADQPDRSVWHRAECAFGPDELVAAELEAAAGRALRRRGTSLALFGLKRAAELSEEPAHQGARLLTAVELAFELGRYDLIPDLLNGIDRPRLTASDRRRLVWLEEFLVDVSGSGTAEAMLAVAEQLLEEGEIKTALDALMLAVAKCYWFGADQRIREQIVELADRFPRSEYDPTLLQVFALVASQERGALIIERAEEIIGDSSFDSNALRDCGIALLHTGEFKLAASFFDAAVDGLRSQGRLALLVRALSNSSAAASTLGDLDKATVAAEEAGLLAQETNQPRWEGSSKLQMGIAAALRGEFDRAETLISEGEAILAPFRSSGPWATVVVARARLAHAAGRHHDAFALFRSLFDPADRAYFPGWGLRGLIDLAESAVHSDQKAVARAIIATQRERAIQIDSPTLRMLVDQADAILATDETADELLGAAVSDASYSEYSRARLGLVYGGWLRRQQRVVEARSHLRTAGSVFDSLHAHPFAERANQELRASGDTSRPRTRDTRGELTPQELQIVELASQGFTNREIGERLFLSHRTVGSHLYRAFPKLGISSRSELRQKRTRY